MTAALLLRAGSAVGQALPTGGRRKSIRIELDDDFERNMRKFAGLMDEKKIRRWTKNSLNFAIRWIRGRVARDVAAEVRIDKDVLLERFRTQLATTRPNGLGAVVNASMKPIPLHLTGHATQNARGVVVSTDKFGDRFYPHHFIQFFRGQNIVFDRDQVEGEGRVPRYPLIVPKEDVSNEIEHFFNFHSLTANRKVSEHFERAWRRAAR